jgi:hypothetical protein
MESGAERGTEVSALSLQQLATYQAPVFSLPSSVGYSSLKQLIFSGLRKSRAEFARYSKMDGSGSCCVMNFY